MSDLNDLHDDELDQNGANPDPSQNDPSGIDTLSGVERFLTQFGIEGGKVSVAQEGSDSPVEAHFNDLDSEQQVFVLNQLLNESTENSLASYDLDEQEVEFLNYTRDSGKSLADALNDIVAARLDELSIMQGAMNEDIDALSDEAAHARFIRLNNPNVSDEDIIAEVNRLKESKFFTDNAKQYKEIFKSKQEELRQAQHQEQLAAYEASLEEDRVKIATVVDGMREIAGVELQNEDKNEILGKILEVDQNGNSTFLSEAFSDPQKLFKAAWLFYNGEPLIDQMTKDFKKELSEAYTRGRADALRGAPTRSFSAVAPRQNVSPTSTSASSGNSLADLHDED
jgi:hypothetical protein